MTITISNIALTITETSAADTVATLGGARVGNFEATDTEGTGITYAVTASSGGTVAPNTNEEIVAADPDATPAVTAVMSTHSIVGNYGTLFYNADTGDYKYVPIPSAFDGESSTLTDDETFTITATDDTDSADTGEATLSITIGA